MLLRTEKTGMTVVSSVRRLGSQSHQTMESTGQAQFSWELQNSICDLTVRELPVLGRCMPSSAQDSLLPLY